MLPSLRSTFLLSFGCLSLVAAAQRVATGQVVDARTAEPLPFVHVVLSGADQGTLADADGRFQLPVSAFPARLVFTCVGYTAGEAQVEDALPVMVRLEEKSRELREAVVRPGVNPAHRIIEAVFDNRKRNDGLNAGSFRYKSYAKTVFTIEADSTMIGDSARVAALDTNQREILDFTAQQHLLLIESATERSCRPPNKDHEEVLAMRVSGFEDPGLIALAASTRTFSMYEPLIPLGEKSYMSPIGAGTTRSYLFVLEDTLYQGADTVFVISYRPRTGKNFDGLAGTLWVNSDGYALQNVVAGPVKRGEGQGIKVQQVHRKVNGTWFPVQLNTTFFFDGLSVNGFQPLGIGRVQLRDIETGIELSRKDVRGAELEVGPMALKRDEEYWRALRTDTLDAKDLKTYHVIDSLSKAENLGKTLKGLDAFLTGRIPWGFVDIDLRRLVSANAYEDIRLGIGLSTNDRISRVAKLGGWFGYGFGDKGWKYGADLRVKPIPARSFELRGYYANDLVESAGVAFQGPRSLLLSDDIRLLYMDRMDRVERIGGEVQFRIGGAVRVWVGSASELRINDLGYRYVQPLAENVQQLIGDFRSGEVSMDVRYAFREQVAQLPDRQVNLGTKWPVLHVSAATGIEGLWGGEQEWWRASVMTEKSFRTRRLGTPSLRIMVGIADAEAPYPFLFNIRGTRGKEFWVNTPYAFETMAPGEFLADRFVAVHYRHSFGKLLLKTKKWQPIPGIVSSAGVGALDHPEGHRGYAFRSMEKGFFESGVEILFKNQLSALGLGLYYRYGEYALPDATDNLYLKLTLGIGI
ncbi:MAG: DUF5686 family protein [Flavobacteriales bacterium]